VRRKKEGIKTDAEMDDRDAPLSNNVVQKFVCPFKNRTLCGRPCWKLDSRWWIERYSGSLRQRKKRDEERKQGKTV